MFRSQFAALLIVALVAHAAQAQTIGAVRGTVLLPDSSRATGVIIVATGTSDAVVARAPSNENGEFDLPLARPGHYQLRVLRIGFRPTVVPDIEIAAGEVRTRSIVLRGEAVLLAAVSVRGQTVCHVQQDTAQIVAHLWEEARKAITATQLSPAGATQTVSWTTYDRATDLSGGAVLWEKDDRYSAAAAKVFGSLPPDSLAKVGFLKEEAASTVYRAPDAEALLSDAFVALHCFHVEPPQNHRDDWVGIGFSPARTRAGLVDIEGTLWLDRTSSELRLLEFRYTNLPDEDAHVQAGGRVEFLRLSTGRWLVSRWQLRMPRLQLKHVFGSSDEIKRVADGLQFTGGEVTAVQRGEEVLFSSGRTADADAPTQFADEANAAHTCHADLTNGELASLLRGTVFEGAHRPVAGASVRISWRAENQITGPYSFNFRDEAHDLMSGASGAWNLCPVPRERVITVRATIGNRNSAPVTVVIPRDRSWVDVDVVLPERRP
jgi:hypothetical protein